MVSSFSNPQWGQVTVDFDIIEASCCNISMSLSSGKRLQPEMGMRSDHIDVNGVRIPVQIHYENRYAARASIGKRAVYIRLPLFWSPREKRLHITRFKSWAEKTLQRKGPGFAATPYRTYKDGDGFQAGGKTYVVRIERKDRKTSRGRLEGNCIFIELSSGLPDHETGRTVSNLVSRCIGQDHLPELRDMIYGLNRRHFGMNIGRIAYKYTRSIWGSCSVKGNISISTRLLLAPKDVLEYVCVHELAHLVERSHSKRFWGLVEGALPGYPEIKRWLKDHQDHLWF
jgi:predicted metal-dependent hydrolase